MPAMRFRRVGPLQARIESTARHVSRLPGRGLKLLHRGEPIPIATPA
jgi:hypothetical protein